MLNQPMSSPMMTSMFGRRCCCANACVPATITATNTAISQSHVLPLLILHSLQLRSAPAWPPARSCFLVMAATPVSFGRLQLGADAPWGARFLKSRSDARELVAATGRLHVLNLLHDLFQVVAGRVLQRREFDVSLEMP